jgi:WD40 repeat protein/cell division protein FtsL
MSSSIVSAADSPIDMRYPSLVALQTAHNDLLRRQRQESDTPTFQAAVLGFLWDGTATGALLDADDDRRAAQSILDYWAARLFRLGQEPSDSTLANFDPHLAPEIPDKLCPYLGLDAFREDDATKFYGRTRLVAELIGQLASHRLIAVVGPSGSGKSSLVRAGLIPALKAGALPGSQNWHYLPPIVPGSDPLASLVRVLDARQPAITADQPPADSADDGQPTTDNEQPIADVLVVDQFEELWTLCDDGDARQTFIAKLLALAEAPGAEHRVILTMRSDFETFVARAPKLQALFEVGRVQVTPLSAAELREAIEQPAEAIGLKFEAGVVDLLLQDILGEQAGLPLLQFTLLKLWEGREHNRVTRLAYEQAGGGRLALARSADAFYIDMIPEEQVTARRILLRMVRPGEGLEITSRRVRREDLFRGGEDPGRVERVLARLIAARLVRLTPSEASGDDQVEVAHEALVRNWPTLVDWLEEEKAALATRRRLEGRAAEWVRLGQGAGGLLDEIELHEAERWLSSSEAAYLGYDPALPVLVEASRATIEESEREKEAARLRELAQARQLVVSQTRAKVMLRVLIVLMAIVSLWIIYQQRQLLARSMELADKAVLIGSQAQQNERIAQTAQADERAQRLVAVQQSVALATAEAQVREQLDFTQALRLGYAAQGQVQHAPETALLLGYEAVSRASNSIGEEALRTALDQTGWRPSVLAGHTDVILSAAFSPDGQHILTASGDHTLRLWDASGKLDKTFQGHAQGIESAVFSLDGQRILTASDDRTAQLWDLQGQVLAALRNHTAAVLSADFSPDGQHVLTTSADRTARLWDLNGRELAVLRGHSGVVRNAAFSPDGQRIVTASFDGSARLWDASGQEIATLQGHTAEVWNAVFSPDGQYILTASFDNTARLWDLNGQQVAVLQGHTGRVWSAVFSPDGQRILTSSSDNTAGLWDLSGKPLNTLNGHIDILKSAVFSPDGQRILTASFDNTARLWDVNGQLLATLAGHTDGVQIAVFSPNGQRILTASFDNTARLWDEVGPPLKPLLGHTDSIHSAVFSPDGQRILTSSSDNTARLWNLNGQELAVLSGHTDAVVSAVFSPDGQRILTSSSDQTARLWNLNGQELAVLSGHTDAAVSAVFSPDGQRILTASADKTARLWDLNGQELAVLSGHTDAVVSAIFSPDGQRILTGSFDNTARLWDANGQALAVLSGHSAPLRSVAFSPDGQRILTGSSDNTARLWDLRGQAAAVLRGHTNIIRSGVFSPSGQQIITVADDWTARLWNLDGQQVAILQGHTAKVWSAAFSPDGQRILTASDDRTARLWDSSGKPLATLQGHSGPVYAATFSPDGVRLLTASQDSSARQYLVNVSDLLQVAVCRVGRGLTTEEIARFQVPTPLKFDFDKRQCPPALGN